MIRQSLKLHVRHQQTIKHYITTKRIIIINFFTHSFLSFRLSQNTISNKEIYIQY